MHSESYKVIVTISKTVVLDVDALGEGEAIKKASRMVRNMSPTKAKRILANSATIEEVIIKK